MKTTLDRISFLKYTDLGIQFIAFAIMLLLMGFSDWGPFAFFVEAAVQVTSCLVWSCYFRVGVPRYRAGIFIRRVFWVVLVAWILASLFSDDTQVYALYLMLVLGPLLGLAYFMITAIEAGYYSKARKPYYLL